MSDGHGAAKVPRGAKRYVFAVAIFVFFALLQESNSKLLHYLPQDLFSRGEIRLTSDPKLTGEKYEVKRVVDGDTLVINYAGTDEKVRLIGVNTPETVDPRRPVECFGKEASAHMKSLAEGKMVYIETDSTQGTRDKYGRLLLYVYLEDGQMLNRKMIAEGYAYEYTYLHPYKYKQDFVDALSFAKNAKVGLWADEACRNEALNH